MEERTGEEKAGAEGARAATQPPRAGRAPGPPAGLARPAEEGGGRGDKARSARPRPGYSGAGPWTAALPPPAALPPGSGRSLPGPGSSPAAGRGAWGRGTSGSTGPTMALLLGPPVRAGRGQEGRAAGRDSAGSAPSEPALRGHSARQSI